MNLTDRHLLREIILVLIVKVLILAALWWSFVRDVKVPVDSSVMAGQIVNSNNSKLQQRMGESNAQ